MHDGKTKTHFVALPYENWILACTREMGLAAAKINLSKKKKAQLFMLYWSEKVLIYSREVLLEELKRRIGEKIAYQ